MTFNTDNKNHQYIKHTLEPIVELNAGNILSFEMVSYTANRMVLDEHYFCNAERRALVSLFIRQLEFFQKLNRHDEHLYHTVFINVEPAAFNELISWEDFLPFVLQFNINIEFDNEAVSNGIPDETIKNVSQLRELGVKLWIKNADEAVRSLADELQNAFDGIKINKRFFWQCFNRNDTTFIEHVAAIWGSESVIVEGVENKHHLSFVKAQGLVQGQGFHWRARLLRHTTWH